MTNFVELRNIAKITSGSTAPKETEFTQEEGVPFIRAAHLKSLCEGVSLSKLPKLKESSEKRLKLKRVPKDSILFAKSGMSATKNRIYQLKADAYIVNHLASVLPDPKLIDPKYLYYYLKWFKTSRLVVDESYPSIRLSDIGKIEVPLISLDQQKEIVNKIEIGEQLVLSRREEIKLFSRLISSIYLEMFGDPVLNPQQYSMVLFKDLGEWKSGGTPARKTLEYFKGDIPWITSGELNELYIETSKECITEDAIENSNAKLIKPGSLLVGMYDSAALKTSINTVECCCNQAIAYALLDSKKVSTVYMYYYIQLAKDFLKRQQRGVRQKNLNISMVKSFQIPLPPIQDQLLFEKKVLAIKNTEGILIDSLSQYEKLFTSLLNESFNYKY